MARQVEERGGGCTALLCDIMCVGLELVTIGKKKPAHFFVTLLCSKDSVSAQMHAGSVLVYVECKI